METVKTDQYFYIKDDVLTLETDQGYFLALEDLFEFLGVPYTQELNKISENPELMKGYAKIEVTYGNNKKDTKQCLNVARLPEYLFTLNSNDVKQERKEALADFKSEAIKLINKNFQEASELNPDEKHNLSANQIDQAGRRDQLQKEVDELEKRKKQEEGKLKYATEQLEKEDQLSATEQAEMSTRKIDAQHALNTEINPTLEDKKKQLKQVKQTIKSIKEKNNPAKNMLENIFS